MNRYTTQGIVSDFLQGKEITVVVAPGNTGASIISQIEQYLAPGYIRSIDVYSSGLHKITASRGVGSVTVVPYHYDLRGCTTGVLLVPAAHGHTATPALTASGAEYIAY